MTTDYTTDLFIDAEPRIVWDYWTDPACMREWWGIAAELDPRPGGLYRVIMAIDGPVMLGEYLEVVPFERIVFSFGWEREGYPGVEPKSTTVEVQLAPEAGGTRLSLRHSGLPPAAHDAHREGWTHFLGVLQARFQT